LRQRSTGWKVSNGTFNERNAANLIANREQQEEILNSHPHFMAKIQDDDGAEYNMHFMALFSQRKDAIPIVLLHGWPGMFDITFTTFTQSA
jgi:Epoxide hydrolase N terminus